MKYLSIGLFLFFNLNCLGAEESEKGFYYLFLGTSPVQNGLVYYEKDEKLMKLYGDQGLEGFEGFSFNVSANYELTLSDFKGDSKIKFGRVDQNECGEIIKYNGELVSLCLVKFLGENKIKVRYKRSLGGFTDAYGIPQISRIQKNFNFTLILDGKAISKTNCINHFLSCRM